MSNPSDVAIVAAPTPVSATLAVAEQPNLFEPLGLAAPLLRALADLGFTQPTPVQEHAIPAVLNGGDWMVSSQTGSGKTAAFLLPMLQTLLAQREAQAALEKAAAKEAADAAAQAAREAAERGEPAPAAAAPKKPKRHFPPRHLATPAPAALVLCPTRELAQQVMSDAIDLVRHMRGMRIASIVGGTPFGIQIAKLQGANLVVATPGRLLDLQRRMQIKLDEVQFLVVDEADRMLDLGFSEDLEEIHHLTSERNQTMMFSATFAPRIMALAARVMRQPQKIELQTAQTRHDNIAQALHWVDNLAHKRRLLDHYLRDASLEQAVVFASTQIETDALAGELASEGHDVAALHGAMPQGLRNRQLRAFRDGHVRVLVATDVAARGLDVPGISHVINFGLPMKAEDYVHRIGRTGRAGKQGVAVTLAEARDRRRVMDIEQYTRQPLKASVVPGLEPAVREPVPQRPRLKPGQKPGRGHFKSDFNGRSGDRFGDRPAGGGFNREAQGTPRPVDRNPRGSFVERSRDEFAHSYNAPRRPAQGASQGFASDGPRDGQRPGAGHHKPHAHGFARKPGTNAPGFAGAPGGGFGGKPFKRKV
jgi:superfamily II DNA/RNA helicase